MSENEKRTEEAVAVFKCLGDNTRFSIVSLLAQSDSYVELLAEKLSLTAGTVCHHLKKLEDAGLVRCSRSQYYQIYSLNREIMGSGFHLPDHPIGRGNMCFPKGIWWW